MYTLRQLCELTGCSRRAIQGYEKEGLIQACGKNKMGHLLYEEGVLKEVEKIVFFQEVGFTVKEIAAYNMLGKDGRLEVLQKKYTEAVQQLERLECNIAKLEDMIQ